MTWVIEVEVGDVASGPLHGELCVVVSDALEAYAPGYAQKVSVTWRPDNATPDQTTKEA